MVIANREMSRSSIAQFTPSSAVSIHFSRSLSTVSGACLQCLNSQTKPTIQFTQPVKMVLLVWAVAFAPLFPNALVEGRAIEANGNAISLPRMLDFGSELTKRTNVTAVYLDKETHSLVFTLPPGHSKRGMFNNLLRLRICGVQTTNTSPRLRRRPHPLPSTFPQQPRLLQSLLRSRL